jgi:hypothetical protein
MMTTVQIEKKNFALRSGGKIPKYRLLAKPTMSAQSVRERSTARHGRHGKEREKER